MIQGDLVLDEQGRTGERRRIVNAIDLGKPVLLDEAISVDPTSRAVEVVGLLESMVANELVVASDEAMSRGDLERLVAGTSWTLKRVSKSGLIATLEARNYDLNTVKQGIELLSNSVENAFGASLSPNRIYYALATKPNDKAFTDQWALDDARDNDIDAPEGWDILTDSSPVTVAIVDTGIRYSHQDLKANMWRNPGEIAGNGLDDDGNGYVDDVHGANIIARTGAPLDDNGHGTHVAGIVGAEGDNGVGVSGVAWRAKLMAVKFLNASGRGGLDDAVDAIDYAVANGARIINASWGGDGEDAALAKAIARALARDVAIVAAAGNDFRNNDEFASYPASSALLNVISVASSTRDGTYSSFSNYGVGTTDLVAPGESILSTWYDADDSYSLETGTSMAAPIVSGILALNMALRPNDSLKTQIGRLVQSSRGRTDLRFYARSGGVVDLASSLAMDVVLFPPKIVERSEQSVAKLVGESVTFSVEVESETAVTYHWYFGDAPLPGETGSSLTLGSITKADAGTYRIVAANHDGEASAEFKLRALASNDELEEGLDADGSVQVFSRDGSPWILASDPLSRDGDHIEAEHTEKYGTHTLSAIVRGPGEVRFLWRLANASDYTSRATCQVGEQRESISYRREEWRVGRFVLSEDMDYEIQWEWTNSGDERANGGQLQIDYLKLYPIGQVPPIIFLHPQDQTVRPFSGVYVGVGAYGSDLTYKWYKDEQEIPAGDTALLNFRSVGVDDGGKYSVVVSNPFGTEESREGTLTVDESQTPARFVERTERFSGMSGDKLELSLEHVGSPPMTYKWRRGYNVIPGQTGPSLDFDKLRMADAGYYQLEIENPYGDRQVSDTIFLTVTDRDLAPDALLDKRDLYPYRLREGDPFDIAHYLEYQSDSMTYQWYQNGLPLEGQTSLHLAFDRVTPEQTGIYSIEVKNAYGSFRDDVYVLRVDSGINAALDVESGDWTDSPFQNGGWRYGQREVSINDGDAVEFSREYAVYASAPDEDGAFDASIGSDVVGPVNLSFYWKRTSENSWFEVYLGSRGGVYDSSEPFAVFTSDAGTVDGWQKSTFHVPDGQHYIRIQFVGGDGAQKGWLDKLETSQAPAFVGYIPDRVLAGTDTASVTVTAWGGGSIAYQWYRNGTPLAGETSATLSFAADAVNSDDEYTLTASSEFGLIASSPIRFIPVQSILGFDNARLAFGGNAAWEPSPWNGEEHSLTFNAFPGESARMDLRVAGPATVVWNSSAFLVDIDDNPVTSKGWARAVWPYGSYVNVPAGEHKVTFRAGNDSTSSSPYRFTLGGLAVSSPVFIESRMEEIPSTTIGAYQRWLSVNFAADLPASGTWYKDGKPISTETATTSSITYARAFGGNYRPPTLDDVGEYYCEVTDANGVTKRSETFEVTPVDILTFGEVIGDAHFDLADSYQPFEYDTSVFLDGGVSARVTIPQGWDNSAFQVFNHDGIDDRYAASEFSVKIAGYDATTSVRIFNGMGTEIELEHVDGWQNVRLDGNSGNNYFSVEKGVDSQITIWIDGARSVGSLRILSQPLNYGTYLGGKVEFSVDAFSIEPIVYQWRHDGQPIEGATEDKLELASMKPDDLGDYDVELMSQGKTVVSESATLSALPDFGAALEMPGLRVTTWGSAFWRIDKSVSIDGTSSLRSGDAGENGVSGIRLEFDSPGGYSLYLKSRDDHGGDRVWEVWSGFGGDNPPVAEYVIDRRTANSAYAEPVVFWIDRLSVAPLASMTYQRWIADRVSVSGLLSQTDLLTDESADTDGDGNPNYVEYLFGLDPFEKDQLPELLLGQSGDRLVLDFNGRFVANDEYGLMFEYSEDLKDWRGLYPDREPEWIGDLLYYRLNGVFDLPVDSKKFVRRVVVRFGDPGAGLGNNEKSASPLRLGPD